MQPVGEMIEVGKKLGELKLIDGASGNLSCRVGNFMIITKSGAILDELTPQDFIYVEIGRFREGISSDWKIHSEIYMKTGYKAVVHCHGVYNVILSISRDEVVPSDLEGKLFLKTVRVVEGEREKIADVIAKEISRSGIVIHRCHGIYSAGMNVKEAFIKACYLEHSCEILYRLDEY